MKRLLVWRHAHAEAGSGDDHGRRLDARGREQAAAVARHLVATGPAPEALLVSTAARARETAAAVERFATDDLRRRESRRLYAGGVPDAIEEIRCEAAATGTLLVVGHEPTLSALVGTLIGDGAVRMSKGALARIDLEIDDWSEVAPRRGTLRWLITPPHAS